MSQNPKTQKFENPKSAKNGGKKKRKHENVKIRKVRKMRKLENAKIWQSKKCENEKNTENAKIWKDRKYGKSEKEPKTWQSILGAKKPRENVTVKKGENGDKAETHSVSIFRASAISNHVQSVVAYNGGAQCP